MLEPAHGADLVLQCLQVHRVNGRPTAQLLSMPANFCRLAVRPQLSWKIIITLPMLHRKPNSCKPA